MSAERRERERSPIRFSIAPDDTYLTASVCRALTFYCRPECPNRSPALTSSFVRPRAKLPPDWLLPVVREADGPRPITLSSRPTPDQLLCLIDPSASHGRTLGVAIVPVCVDCERISLLRIIYDLLNTLGTHFRYLLKFISVGGKPTFTLFSRHQGPSRTNFVGPGARACANISKET